VFQQLSDHIAKCVERANAAELRASEAIDEVRRSDHKLMAQYWRDIVRSYQFVESLERFLIEIERARNAWSPEARAEK
jgi:hypothetical protein